MFYAKEENKRKRWYRILTIGQKKLLALGGAAGVLVLAFLGTVIFYSCRAMQYDMQRMQLASGACMLYDASNQPISSLSGTEERPLLWQELPQNLVDAFVAREDARFFEHNGVVFSSVIRSVLRNLTSMRYEQGASTITMQLARNIYELRDKSMDRKLLEVMLAQRIERNFDKQTIMLQYLSRIYYGQNCYGIRAAAEHYFGKQVSELNLVECATLAGLVRAPSIFNPVHSMDDAMEVKAETLERMLECEMISEEECRRATAAPIELVRNREADAAVSSYASMWARMELRELQEEAGKGNGGVYVVSSLRLPLQQYLERAVEAALTAVEDSKTYPEAWLALSGNDTADAEERRKSFMKMKRPEKLRVRGSANDLTGLLQSCVLVVDNRNRHKGRVLALVSGRSAVDGVDRWQTCVQPGRASAPLLFACACLPGGEDMHIVARDSQVTGMRLGYPVVRAFYDTLKLDCKLPSQEDEKALYNGEFGMKKIDLARILFSIQNKGRGYKLSLINAIWSNQRTLLYSYEPEKAPEYILRQSARAVMDLPPFPASEGLPVTLNETLPGHTGQFSMVLRENGVAVFVWMGFDKPDTEVAASGRMTNLLRRASMNLAREVYEAARAELRREAELKKQQEEQQNPAAQARS